MKEFVFSERHMGTDVTVSLVCDSSENTTLLSKEIFMQIQTYEKIFSRFDPESTLSKLNHGESKKVNAVFIQVLKKSFALSKATKGAFNPLMQVSRLGYRGDFESLPRNQEVSSTFYDSDISHIHISEDTEEVTLPEDAQLDFGGMLKGYLATKIATSVSAQLSCIGGIVNLGGDLATFGRDELHKPFMFNVYNPVTDSEYSIPLEDTALASSGTYARMWHTTHGTQHHIVDSRTHRNPQSDVVAASVVHEDGALAEALTKLFITRGVEETLQTVPPNEYQYFCVYKNGKIESNLI